MQCATYDALGIKDLFFRKVGGLEMNGELEKGGQVRTIHFQPLGMGYESQMEQGKGHDWDSLG